MPRAEFVHLHLHTEHSLLDACCRPDALMARAAELGFPAVAMTDHGVMYGAVEFWQAAKAAGVKPILGCEVYVAPGSRLDKKPARNGGDNYHHLVLLARDQTGYRNLIRLVTAAHLEGFYYKPRIDKALLAQHAHGLIALSGCLASEVPDLILRGEEKQARDTVDWFRQTLGPDSYFLELQNHGIPEQAKVNRALIPWAKEFGLKTVATNDVHYVERGDWEAHECLVCLGRQTVRDPAKRVYLPEQFYLRSAEEMQARFAEVPEAVRNTLAVAERCDVEIQFGRGAEHYPVFQPPETWTREGWLRKLLCEGLLNRYGVAARVEGRQIVVEAVREARRLEHLFPPGPHHGPLPRGEGADPVVSRDSEAPPAAGSQPKVPPLPEGKGRGEGGSSLTLQSPEVQHALKALLDRLELELGVIEKTGYLSYFLIVGDFVRWGRERGIACVARGSAAGSLVTYLLEIANVDPLRYGLLFERFLNPERVSPPDIDIDFADDRRAEVIEHVRQKYGREAVAQIVTFGTMGAKSAVRDVARVLGQGFSEGDRLAKFITDMRWSLDEALQKNPEFKAAYQNEPGTRELVDIARRLENQARSAGVHAAGVVIGAQPLVNLLPLKQDDDGGIVTQYAMGPVGDLGLLKMDFLGLKTLTVLRNTVELVKRTRGVTIDPDSLPLDDAKTYELLNHAQTLGVFQLESGGMRDLCKKFQIESIEHITALISLYRPGPMDLIPDFIERRHGRAAAEPVHPLLGGISRETYGVLIYQEQVMQAAQILAGYTLGGADLLRRAMGKKKPEEMARQRSSFVEGCQRVNDIPAAEANKIFDVLEKFAGYGFNKSHAAAYALVAYQTAYLKANHPVEFFAAMMTNDLADTDKLAEYIAEAKGMGIAVLPPEVNESDVYFAPAAGTVDGTTCEPVAAPINPQLTPPSTHPGIRFGLAAIKGVGEIAVQSLLEARRAGGRFASLTDFCERVDTRAVNRKAIEALVKCGACDALGGTRAALFAQIDGALARGQSLAQDRARGQSSLFSLLAAPAAPAAAAGPAPAGAAEWPLPQRLADEKALLGFYVTGHPLEPYAALLRRYGMATTGSLGALPNRAVTRLGGIVSAVQQGVSKKSGKPYALVTLEDLEGTVQLLCMNEAFDRHRELVTPGRVLFVVGEVSTGEDKPKVFPQDVLPIEEVPRRFTSQVFLRLVDGQTTATQVRAVRELVGAHAGQVPLFLCVVRPGGERVYIEANDRFAVTPSLELEQAVEHILGPGAWHVRADDKLPERPRRAWERNGD